MFLLVAFLCLNSFTALGQDQTVSGTVTSATDNEPVIGATVKVKGQSGGTITDIDGKFSIKIGKQATLVVSYVGYVTQEATARGGKSSHYFKRG